MAAKFVVASLAATAAVAEPSYYGYGGGYGGGVARHYGGGSSYIGRTIWGLGKRSADAEPEAEAEAYGYGGYPAYGYGYGRGYGYGYGRGIAGHPGGATSYYHRSPQGIGKRSADAEPEADAEAYGYGYPAYGYGYGRAYGYGFAGRGVAGHPGGARSFTYRSPQGIGKRSADAEPEADAEAYGYGYNYPAYGYGRAYAYGPAVAGHYGGGSSYTYRSPQGLRGKRSAEPLAYGRSFQSVSLPYANAHYSVSRAGYGASVYEDNFNGAAGYGYGYYGRGKRSAEPYGYGARSFQTVSRPGSTYSVRDAVYSANVNEQSARYGAAYGYGFNSGYYGRY